MPPDYPGFFKRNRHLIDYIFDNIVEAVPPPIIARELYTYVHDYNIDLEMAVEALIRKHEGRPRTTEIRRLVFGGSKGLWSLDKPAPSFALDPLEAEMLSALLEQAEPDQLAAAMEVTGYDAETVARHLPVFSRKWSEIRKEKWAQIFVMERPEET
jgi:hypothetical protein